MADETRKVLLQLEIDTIKAVKNIADLKALQKAANQEFEKTKIGTEEYKKLETVTGLLTKRVTGLRDATKQNTKELDVQKGSARDLSAQYSALTRALREAAPGSQVLGMSFDEAKKKANSLRQEVKEFEAQLGNTAPNVGNYGNAFKEATGGIQVFGQSLSGLFQMILTNPIGLIVAGLTLLAKMLMQNDTIATAFKGVMTGLGVVFDQISAFVSEVVLSLSEFGGEASETSKIIKDVFIRVLNQLLAPLNFIIDIMPAVNAALAGDFKKSATIAGEAGEKFAKSVVFMNDEMPKFIDNISEAVKVGIEYEKSLDAIEAKQSKLNVSQQQLTNQRDRFLLQSKDLSKSEEDRIALLEKAEAIDKRIFNERVALLDEEIAAQKKYVEALGNDSVKREEAEFRLNDLTVKRLEAENESLKFQEKAQNKRNAIIEKQIASDEKLAEQKEKDRLKGIEDEKKLTEKTIESNNKLAQFKLDLAAKNAKTIDEKLRKELHAEDFRVKVLLSNENLLASEKEFILADSAARIEGIVKKSEEAQRAEAKKTADDKIKNTQNTVTGIGGILNSAAEFAKTINETQLNNDLTALDKKKQAELKAAGNNAAKKAKIEERYNKEKEKIEKDSAKKANRIALIQALINTGLAITKALPNLILAGIAGALGFAQVAKIKSEDSKFAKGGIIGGLPHSQGGTKFVGSDGSRFEAEKDEAMVIVNKHDTPLLSKLSSINSIHGKPFFKDGGAFFADGGFAARSSSQPVIDSINTSNQVIDMISSIQFPPVTVEDINAGVGRRTQVVSRANI